MYIHMCVHVGMRLHVHVSTHAFSRTHRCGWHEQRENRFCSLGTVNVYCYVLSDNLCAKYGIALTKNHLPEKVSSPACTVVAPSRRVSGPGRGARARWPVSPSPIPPGR